MGKAGMEEKERSRGRRRGRSDLAGVEGHWQARFEVEEGASWNWKWRKDRRLRSHCRSKDRTLHPLITASRIPLAPDLIPILSTLGPTRSG